MITVFEYTVQKYGVMKKWEAMGSNGWNDAVDADDLVRLNAYAY